jgi:hypothetical protein
MGKPLAPGPDQSAQSTPEELWGLENAVLIERLPRTKHLRLSMSARYTLIAIEKSGSIRIESSSNKSYLDSEPWTSVSKRTLLMIHNHPLSGDPHWSKEDEETARNTLVPQMVVGIRSGQIVGEGRLYGRPDHPTTYFIRGGRVDEGRPRNFIPIPPPQQWKNRLGLKSGA